MSRGKILRDILCKIPLSDKELEQVFRLLMDQDDESYTYNSASEILEELSLL